jgi:type I restriction-modification system DNA methylase subunit
MRRTKRSDAAKQGKPAQAAVDSAPTNNGPTLSKLEAHLWEAANILRGTVDAADFKRYVFPLLFF